MKFKNFLDCQSGYVLKGLTSGEYEIFVTNTFLSEMGTALKTYKKLTEYIAKIM